MNTQPIFEPIFETAEVQASEIHEAEVSYSAEDMPPVRGIMIGYINVGTLSPIAAEQYVSRMKDTILVNNCLLPRLQRQGIEAVFIPVRDSATRIETCWLQ